MSANKKVEKVVFLPETRGRGPILVIDGREFDLSPEAVFRLARAGCLAADYSPQGFNEAPYVVACDWGTVSDPDDDYVMWAGKFDDLPTAVLMRDAIVRELELVRVFDDPHCRIPVLPDLVFCMDGVEGFTDLRSAMSSFRGELIRHPISPLESNEGYWTSFGFQVSFGTIEPAGPDAALGTCIRGLQDVSEVGESADSILTTLLDGSDPAIVGSWLPRFRHWARGNGIESVRDFSGA